MTDDMQYGTGKPVNENVTQAGAVKGQVPDGSFKSAGANVSESTAKTFSGRMGGAKGKTKGGSGNKSSKGAKKGGAAY
jgi:hypothetical protein